MASEVWTIKSCRAWTIDHLRSKGEERPQLSAEWLLCAATGLSRTELYMNFNRVLTPAELATMHQGVVRRLKGEPLQYITGETQFRMIKVNCTEGVLIPRPETEILVDEVLKYLDTEVLGAKVRAQLSWNAEIAPVTAQAASAVAYEEDEDMVAAAEHGEDAVFGVAAYDTEDASEPAPEEPEEAEAAEVQVARVLEVGCGTGCISLSLAYERRGQVSCIATDIEPRAVELAQQNRDALRLSKKDARFLLTNLVSAVPRDMWASFDVLVSNPPYIPSAVMEELPAEVADFEPTLALDGGTDGLDIYRRLLNAAPHMLKPGGLFVCELFEDACEPAAELCRAAGFEGVEIVSDLAGRPRIVKALKPHDMQVKPLASV